MCSVFSFRHSLSCFIVLLPGLPAGCPECSVEGGWGPGHGHSAELSQGTSERMLGTLTRTPGQLEALVLYLTLKLGSPKCHEATLLLAPVEALAI